MYLTIKLTLTIPQTFVNGQKYTLVHRTNPLETLDTRFIGTSRIDGYPMFQIFKPDLKSGSGLREYDFNNVEITGVQLVTALEDHLALWNYKESSYQKNSMLLLDYCIDHFKLSRTDIGNDEKFKPMMREIVLNGLLPKE
jgi:hypothetical protein